MPPVTPPLRVLVVDDTVTYRAVISAALGELPGVEVVGVAANGRIALQKIDQLQPDLLTLDLEMPEVDGLEVLRQLKAARRTTGVIMLSAFTDESAHATLKAMELGAFDFVLKPSSGTAPANAQRLRQQLGSKIDAFARSRQIRAILRNEPAGASRAAPPAASTNRVSPPLPPTAFEFRVAPRPEAIALGVSTGGPQALTRLLPQLPADLPAPVLIVQHMPPVFTRSLAEDLDRRCRLRVSEAVDGQAVRPGTILIAPGGKQMKVQRSDEAVVVRITDDPHENSCRPSVDYLFRSVAEVYGPRAIGVIMTGMGNDGARGCRLMRQQGASILAQDQASCVVYGMPRDPIEQGIATAVPLDGLAGEIVRLAGKGAALCR